MSNESCLNCGAPRLPEHKFCPTCGHSFPEEAANEPVRPKQQKAKKPTARDSRKDYIIIAAVIILVAAAYNVVAYLVTDTKTAEKSVPASSGNAQFDQTVDNANHLMDQGQYEKAAQLYEQALQIDSLHPDVIVDLGACYHSLGDNEKASYQFHRALAQQPNQPVALFNMGVVSLTVGDTASAKGWWDRYLKVAPDAPQAKVVREQLSKM